jgi:hypothetical protein
MTCILGGGGNSLVKLIFSDSFLCAWFTIILRWVKCDWGAVNDGNAAHLKFDGGWEKCSGDQKSARRHLEAGHCGCGDDNIWGITFGNEI